MALSEDMKNSAIEQYTDILARFYAEQQKSAEDRNPTSLGMLRDDLKKLENEYGINESTTYPGGTDTVDTVAKTKAASIFDVYKKNKVADLKKELQKAYTEKRKAQVENKPLAVTAADTRLSDIKKELKNKYGLTDDEIKKIEDECEAHFAMPYTSVLDPKIVDKGKKLETDSEEAKDKRAHVIKNYKKGYGLVTRLGLNAILAAASTAVIMHTAAITLALPSLPIIGAAAFASLIAAEGYRTLLSGMFNKRAVTLNEIYDKRLKNANIKLQKIETKAKAKFDVKTGKRSTRYDKKITRQNKRINRIKRRIVHVNKTRTPFTSDVMAAALQALATLVIVSCGGQITAVVGMGIITFLLTKLANKFSKKNMGGLNV